MLSSINDLWENQTNIKGLKKFAFSRSKSRVPWGRVGSIPTAGTNHFKNWWDFALQKSRVPHANCVGGKSALDS